MTETIPASLSENKPALARLPFSKANIAFFLLLYLASALILFRSVGPWETVRHAIVNGAIVAAWLVSSALILRDERIPDVEPIRRPGLELVWGIATLAITITLAANFSLGLYPAPVWIYLSFFYASIFLLYTTGGYSARAIGLSWPSKRGWLALIAVILINLAAAFVFVILPTGEAAEVPQADLANQITGPLSVLLLLLGLLVRAAIPEELLLRVTIQPRLAQFMSLGSAILFQALLFNFAHLPQQLFRDHQPLHLAVAYLLLVDNGLIGGYLWYRTRSLPLLVILHLFAYSRFGI